MKCWHVLYNAEDPCHSPNTICNCRVRNQLHYNANTHTFRFRNRVKYYHSLWVPTPMFPQNATLDISTHIVPHRKRTQISKSHEDLHTVSCLSLYRVIHKSLRDFRTRLRNNQDRHGRKEHINRQRISPSFCHTLQVLDMCTLGDAADVNPVIKFL